MTPARFRYGLILIQIGILIMLRNYGVLNDNFWIDLLVLFPVVLIAIGIEKIFTRTKVQFISYLTSIALFAGGFIIAFVGSTTGIYGDFFTATTIQEDIKPDIKYIKSTLRVADTDITIRDSGDKLILGQFDQYTKKPDYEINYKDDTAFIELTRQKNNFFGGIVKIETGEPQDWSLSFSNEIPLDINCFGEKSDLHFNFATTPVSNLNIDADETIIYVKIGDLLPLINVHVSGEDNSLKLRIPSDLGVRIFGNDYETYLTKIGFTQDSAGFYVNPEYLENEKKVDINLDSDLKSFSLDFF